jgi:hypothetical protein
MLRILFVIICSGVFFLRLSKSQAKKKPTRFKKDLAGVWGAI